MLNRVPTMQELVCLDAPTEELKPYTKIRRMQHACKLIGLH